LHAVEEPEQESKERKKVVAARWFYLEAGKQAVTGRIRLPLRRNNH